MKKTTLLLLVVLSPCIALAQSDAAEQSERPAIEQPLYVTGQMKTTAVRWATEPPETGRKGLFDGRCSKPSDYVVSFTIDGDEPLLGRISGEGPTTRRSNGWTAAPLHSRTASVFVYATSDGDALHGTCSGGTTTWDESTQTGTCRDEFVVTEGTGRFAGASGRGEDRCSFGLLEDALAGVPAPVETIGSISLARHDP